MKKIIAIILVLALALITLTGCVGTTVVIGGECNCPCKNNPGTTVTLKDGEVKTGLAVTTSVSDSTSANDTAEGAAKFDITIAAVTVDNDGIIRSCSIDSVPATVKFDISGQITSDINAEIKTKNELGPDYGMVAWGGAIAEWDEQIKALCDFAVGKSVDDFKNGAVDKSGKAPAGTDLASSATIYLGNYVSLIESAANNAVYLGANSDDILTLTTINTTENSKSATTDTAGTVELTTDIVALTSNGGVITSCIFDAVQAKVTFDQAGSITSDINSPISTKNELGESYGMVAWGGAIAEWDAQAAEFAKYITGKTADQVKNISVTESAKPADGSDLSSSVTISVGTFQSLIYKALSK